MILEKTIGHLVSLLNKGPKPVMLIGAGASIKSGIPSTAEFVDKAAKWAFALENGWPPEDVKIRQSDWMPWLESKSWYNTNLSSTDNYPAVVENLLQPRQARKDFFLRILNQDIPASEGYQKLAELIGHKAFDTILTTNFDSLVAETCNNTPLVHHLTIVKNHDEFVKISTSPEYPQLIHLHGDFENYTDKNLINEIESLDQSLVERIVPILRDHPLIVIGYRGGENSIMKHLLTYNKENADNYKHGIYWCVLENSSLDELPANVKDLSNEIGNNFLVVKIKGFDELISEGIWKKYELNLKSTHLPKEKSSLDIEIHDFKVLNNVSIDDLDKIVFKQRIKRYCDALRIWKPTEIDDKWLESIQIERDLLAMKGGIVLPTFAGYLLFGKNPQREFRDASISVSIKRDELWLEHIFDSKQEENEENLLLEYEITGNLWEQLEEVTDLISQFNKPFRLKGEISQNVLPYPPIAIKELIVNALVHRNYKEQERILITIAPTFIDITNPGGLIDEVETHLGDESIEDKIKRGKRGIKGYRNPVLADFFYGSGAMDKAGSGLSDVYKAVEQYGAAVSFGPIESNSKFNARIYSRPEIVDIITQTAAPKITITSSLVSNILELVSLPESIWVAKTDFNWATQVWQAYPDSWVPPFVIKQGKVFSFYNLDALNNPFLNHIDHGTLESYSIDDFNIDPDREKIFVQLINRCLFSHMYSLGLIVDKNKKRAYFPKIDDNSNRSISYQARIKSATRTVAKRIIKKSTDELLYWEHKSLSFKLEKFGNKWGIVLLPSYVFTVDGFRWLVKNDKIAKLATKRSARDYNKGVLNDFTFWAWVLSSGNKTNFWLQTVREGHGTDPFYDARILGISSNLPKANSVEIDFSKEKEVSIELSNEISYLEEEIAKIAVEEVEKESSNQKGD